MGTEIEVIEHTVTVADATVSKFGFGIPLIAANHAYWPELVRTFETADALTKPPYNVPLTSGLYQQAKALKSQSPSPPTYKIGKLTGNFTQTIKLTPAAPTAANQHYTVTIDGTAVDVVASPPQTVADVVLALVTAINAVADVTATGSTDVTVAGDTTNVVHSFTNISPTLTAADVTPAPSVLPAVDLAAIRAFDGDWYALVMTTPGDDAIKSASGWVESELAIYLAASANSAIPSSATTDVASVLRDQTRHRSSIWYHPQPAEYVDAAVVGRMLPKLPGPITFANKSLSGVTMQGLDATQRQYLKEKHANCYLNIKGLGFTLWGTAASKRFLDVTVAIDWFDVNVEDRIIALLHNNDVVPYTAAGIELVRAQIYAQILDGIALGIIDGQQNYEATAPALESIDPLLKADRILPDMRYMYTLSGAIHKVRVIGIVKV